MNMLLSRETITYHVLLETFPYVTMLRNEIGVKTSTHTASDSNSQLVQITFTEAIEPLQSMKHYFLP